MPRKPAKLSNTYVPLPAIKKEDNTADQTSATIRKDNRSHSELRPLCLETSILSAQLTTTNIISLGGSATGYGKCLGSSLVELGHTKVLCEVNTAPTGTVDQGSLQCQVQFAKHMGKNAILQRLHMVSPLDSATEAFSIGKLQNATTQMEADLSQELTIALQPVLDPYLFRIPKCAILVQVTVLQDDGSVLSTCIGAATLALMDAQVEMTDLVTSCTVAVLNISSSEEEKEGEECIFLADPTQEEMIQAQAVIVLAMTPNHKEVTLWRQSGRLTSDMANQAVELCRSGCRTMHKFLREVWVVSPIAAGAPNP
ncbi:unnamed protein product [Cylindrotheca closterium]|uniref:Uncharacterized protein n=1 Tax=Cylindrotheca closterium TaxID=2856 RepID=A0AAD2CI11_9STRA|nr:unnamed protein product [Cylindrotheca closterium]